MEAKLRMTKSCKFAFVDIDGEGIFIHGKNLMGALDQDIVNVKIIKNKKGHSKGAEGIVTDIVKRGRTKVIGRFQSVVGKPYGHVVASEPLGTDIFISKPKHVRDGELVLCEILDYGNGSKNPNGKILKVIGGYVDTDSMIGAMMDVKDVVSDFDEEIMAEVKEILKMPIEYNRKDLTNIPFIAIDGAETKDVDDAVYVKKNSNGTYRLITAIADVSHYIPYGSKLDIEARRRGNSTYCVGNVIPMLPRELSNGLCSLNEGKEKMVAVFDMEISKKGVVTKSSFYKAIAIIKHNITYEVVNGIINDQDYYTEEYNSVIPMIEEMQELSLILRKKMKSNGNIDFNVEELKIKLNEHGKIKDISLRNRGEAERLIEMFMVTTNIATGEHLKKMKRKNVYRVHDKPNSKKLLNINPIFKKFEIDIVADEKKKYTPTDYQQMVEKIKGSNGETLINKMLLMSMRKAIFSTDEELGHFGLGLQGRQYSMCTSPIRRYADLCTHRILFNYSKEYEKDLDAICEHISETERESAKLEEESKKIKLAEYYKERKMGSVDWGTIVGLSKEKIYVKLENHVEVVLPVPEGYEFDRTKFELKNKSGSEYPIGGEILVKISSVDMREYDIVCEIHYND